MKPKHAFSKARLRLNLTMPFRFSFSVKAECFCGHSQEYCPKYAARLRGKIEISMATPAFVRLGPIITLSPVSTKPRAEMFASFESTGLWQCKHFDESHAGPAVHPLRDRSVSSRRQGGDDR